MSHQDSITDAVLRVIQQVAGGDQQFTLDTTLAELRINSVKIIQMIALLENKLDFELDEADLLMENFSTPRRAITLINAKYCQERVT